MLLHTVPLNNMLTFGTEIERMVQICTLHTAYTARMSLNLALPKQEIGLLKNLRLFLLLKLQFNSKNWGTTTRGSALTCAVVGKQWWA